MGILQKFGYFIKKFLIWEMKLGLETQCEYFQVCVKNGPCGLNSGALFGPNW